jgi:hypothetical protein
VDTVAREETTLVMAHAFALGPGALGPRAVLLDTQCSANASVVCCASLLTNIRARPPLQVTGVGQRTFDREGDTKHFGTVLYAEDFIANVLSFAMVTQRYSVDWLQHSHPPSFVVHLGAGKTLTFHQDDQRNGLYIHWLPSTTAVSLPVTAEPLRLDTVASRKALYTTREVEAADSYQTFQAAMGFASDSDNQKLLGRIKNAPITSRAIGLTRAIYGSSVPILKGKTTRVQPPHFDDEPVSIPTSPRATYQLLVDIMFLQLGNTRKAIPFLVSLVKTIPLLLVAYLPRKSTQELWKALRGHIGQLQAHGKPIDSIHVDGESGIRALEPELNLRGNKLAPRASGEHVPEIGPRDRTPHPHTQGARSLRAPQPSLQGLSRPPHPRGALLRLPAELVPHQNAPRRSQPLRVAVRPPARVEARPPGHGLRPTSRGDRPRHLQ